MAAAASQSIVLTHALATRWSTHSTSGASGDRALNVAPLDEYLAGPQACEDQRRLQLERLRFLTHELLAPIYGWFTEGFDTKDLKEATALLDGLRTW